MNTIRKRTDTVPKYDKESLKRNLERCDNNIILFQQAIDKELIAKVNINELIDELDREA